MKLSNDLISQFVKATKDTTTEKKTETTVYGTVVAKEGSDRYVRFDGANEDTHIDYKNIESTVEADVGDRVIVRIKNHTATIIGNTNPNNRSVGKTTATNIASDTANTAANATFNTLIVDYVKADALFGEQGRFTLLEADVVKINNTLVADYVKAETLFGEEGHITKLDSKVANIEKAYAKTADIEKLYAKSADVENLYAKKAEIEGVYAKSADVEKVYAKKADIQDLESDVANIDELYAKKAEVNNLKSEVADIDTLIFGSATGSTIQTSFANAVIAQLGNAQIKSAMIESVSADKVTAGDIVTNNVRVKSSDGKLLISDETIQISDDTRVRVQIGKDTSNDYSINIWDADGNLMFSEGGITDKAIKDAIIRNDMVSENANISASKLDIDSLFEAINGSTNTIKSTQVKLDEKNQTLDVAFKSLETTVTDQGKTISSQGTSISTIQGKIESKVWQQDIVSAVDDINIGGRNYFIRKNINNLAWTGTGIAHMHIYRGYSFPVNEGETWAVYRTDTTNNRWAIYWFDTEPTVGAMEVSVAMRSDEQAANTVSYLTVPAGISWCFMYLSNQADDIPNIMLEKATKASDWSPAPEDIDDDISTLSTKYGSIEQTVDSISATVAEHTSAISNKANGSTVTELSNKVTEIETDLEGFKTSVSETYATSSELNESKSALESSIDQNKESIDSLVTRTKTVEDKFGNYSTTEEVQSAINQKADSITSSVKSTYATIKSVETVQDNLDGLEIGGRNYFRPSKTVDLGCTGQASGEHTLISTGACIGFYIPVEEGDVWTLSRGSLSNNRFDYCFTIDEPTNGTLIYGWNSGAREQLKIEGIVVPVGSGYKYLVLYLSNQNDELDNVKLERGDKATDWTPAPEDMATAEEVDSAQTTADEAGAVASNAETLVKQLADSISTLVTDGNGTSLMTQTEDGWTFSTANIQNSVNGISEALHSLTDDVGDVNNTVDILKRAVDDLGVIAEYVAITTYENEPCIELGESDSDFKLRITNTRMMFSEGSAILGYFTNNAFNSKKIVVEEELQQSGFVWKGRSNGNLGLIWKGGNS